MSRVTVALLATCAAAVLYLVEVGFTYRDRLTCWVRGHEEPYLIGCGHRERCPRCGKEGVVW